VARRTAAGRAEARAGGGGIRVELVPASTFDLARLAELFTAGYENYFVPFHIDEPMLRTMVDAFDIALDRSRVAVGEEGEPVGLANLAVRGDRGWIGGIGVVVKARRHGIGRQLMESVLADAPDEVWLEVIEENAPAIALYEQLGFERTRMLEVWSLTGDAPASTARPASFDEAHAAIVELRRDRPPWQRDDESLSPDLDGLVVEGGAAVFRAQGGQVNVLQLEARDEHAAGELLAGALASGSALSFVNVPEGDPASAALARLGGTLRLRQFEMVLRSRSSVTTG